MQQVSIPFNRPSLEGDEAAYVAEALRSGHLSGNGGFTKRAESLLESLHGSPRVLLTTSCTHALEMSAMLLGIEPGDEVIMPSFTFVSTANAFVLRGAAPVFADIRPDTLNIDETKIETLITQKTKAICVVHYAGVACEMNAISAIAAKHGLAVVEDNAHGVFGAYRGRVLGTLGRLGTLSFHDTKNYTCGEGGALIVNDASLADRAEIIREKGTNRARFLRGQVDKYSWVDVGSSYVLSDLLAAMLLGQLEARDVIAAKRKAIWERYYRELAPWAGMHGVSLPYVPDGCEQTHHIFYMLMPSCEERDSMISSLKARGIASAFHYVPLHTAPVGQSYGYHPGYLPVTAEMSSRLIRLPFFNSLQPDEQCRVINAVISTNP